MTLSKQKARKDESESGFYYVSCCTYRGSSEMNCYPKRMNMNLATFYIILVVVSIAAVRKMKCPVSGVKMLKKMSLLTEHLQVYYYYINISILKVTLPL